MKMWLENYEDYLKNRNENDLSVNQLRQILYMHGFTKLYGARPRKDVIVNAVNTINLLVPLRSTLELKDEVSPCAFLTTEEVMEDLSTLEWQECSVQSVETLSSGKGKDGSNLDQRTSCPSSVRESVGKLNARKKRKAKNEIAGSKALALASTQSSGSVLSHGSC